MIGMRSMNVDSDPFMSRYRGTNRWCKASLMDSPNAAHTDTLINDKSHIRNQLSANRFMTAHSYPEHGNIPVHTLAMYR